MNDLIINKLKQITQLQNIIKLDIDKGNLYLEDADE